MAGDGRLSARSNPNGEHVLYITETMAAWSGAIEPLNVNLQADIDIDAQPQRPASSIGSTFANTRDGILSRFQFNALWWPNMTAIYSSLRRAFILWKMSGLLIPSECTAAPRLMLV